MDGDLVKEAGNQGFSDWLKQDHQDAVDTLAAYEKDKFMKSLDKRK